MLRLTCITVVVPQVLKQVAKKLLTALKSPKTVSLITKPVGSRSERRNERAEKLKREHQNHPYIHEAGSYLFWHSGFWLFRRFKFYAMDKLKLVKILFWLNKIYFSNVYIGIH